MKVINYISVKVINFIDRYVDSIEWGSLNIIGFSVVGWLVSLMNNFSIIIASIVGLSVVALNIVKLYGIYLDNLKKKKDLEKE